MPPKKKTSERGERKERKTSSKKKEKATVIRDEPEQSLFPECTQSINQPPTASSKPQRKGSVPAQSTINASTKPQRKGRVPAHHQERKKDSRYTQRSARKGLT